MSSDGLTRLNAMPYEHAVAMLLQCCGSPDWAERVAAARPFDDEDALFHSAERVWQTLPLDAVREAFDAHPRIGERKAAAPQTAAAQAWSEHEQAGMRNAAPDMAAEMASLQAEYEARFGHIFLICASGRSADEMLAALRARLRNDPVTEMRIAAEEQRMITRLRLERLVGS